MSRDNMTEYEKAVLNALEYIMGDILTIGRLIASQHPDEKIRNAVEPFLYSSLGITDPSDASPTVQEPSSQRRPEADEN